jgi:integrase
VARATEKDSPTEQWMGDLERHLERAIAYFGADYDLTGITRGRLEAYRVALAGEDYNNGEGFADGSIHQHICTLSSLYGWGMREKFLPSGHNAVDAARRNANGKIPKPNHPLTAWLEVHEVAEMLEWIPRHLTFDRSDSFRAFLVVFAVAVFTGGRKSEIFRLEVGDVDFEHDRIRMGAFTRKGELHNHSNLRYVPMFPQLREILWDYMHGPRAPKGRWLFPGKDGGPITDLSRHTKQLPVPERFRDRNDPRNLHRDKPPKYITWTILRHTYCAARLQSLDNGAPVAKYTVHTELGHGSDNMIDRVYGHLGTARHRTEGVEYRL